MGLAVRSSANQPRTRTPSGQRLPIQTAALRATRPRYVTRFLVELPQVHPRVHRSDLITIAIEHQRLAATHLWNAALGGLTPAGMVDLRVHVRIEAILAGRGLVPGGLGLLRREADLDQGLGALETVLPRHHHAERRAVLVREDLAVEPDGHEGQWMHRLVEPEPFRIGPVESEAEEAPLLPRKHLRVDEGGELDVLGLPRRLHALEQILQGKAYPRNDHGPRLDAAEPVHALLEGELQDLLYVEGLGFGAEPLDLDRPWARLQRGLQPLRVLLVRAELVEVVVGGDIFVRGQGIGQREGGVLGRLEGGELALRVRPGRRQGQRRGSPDEGSAIEIEPLRGDLRGGNVLSAQFPVLVTLDQHELISLSLDSSTILPGSL